MLLLITKKGKSTIIFCLNGKKSLSQRLKPSAGARRKLAQRAVPSSILLQGNHADSSSCLGVQIILCIVNMTGFVLNMMGFFTNMTVFVLNTNGFDSNMTSYVLNITGYVLNITGYVLNRTELVLNMARFFNNLACFVLNITGVVLTTVSAATH